MIEDSGENSEKKKKKGGGNTKVRTKEEIWQNSAVCPKDVTKNMDERVRLQTSKPHCKCLALQSLIRESTGEGALNIILINMHEVLCLNAARLLIKCLQCCSVPESFLKHD